MRQFWMAGCAGALLITAGVFAPASASPIPNGVSAVSTAETGVVEARWHGGRHFGWSRGRHEGWGRGRHEGWGRGGHRGHRH